MIEILGMTDCKPCKEVKAELAQHDLDFAFYNAKMRGNPRTTELKKLYFNAKADVVPAIFLNGEYKGCGKDACMEVIEGMLNA